MFVIKRIEYNISTLQLSILAFVQNNLLKKKEKSSITKLKLCNHEFTLRTVLSYYKYSEGTFIYFLLLHYYYVFKNSVENFTVVEIFRYILIVIQNRIRRKLKRKNSMEKSGNVKK
jgi:hypothetical protein